MKYRKTPVVIDAMRVGDGTWQSVAAWCGGSIIKDRNRYAFILIQTLEGNMRADKGDWIIKGVKGKYYPCKADIFEQTYEKVE